MKINTKLALGIVVVSMFSTIPAIKADPVKTASAQVSNKFATQYPASMSYNDRRSKLIDLYKEFITITDQNKAKTIAEFAEEARAILGDPNDVFAKKHSEAFEMIVGVKQKPSLAAIKTALGKIKDKRTKGKLLVITLWNPLVANSALTHRYKKMA